VISVIQNAEFRIQTMLRSFQLAETRCVFIPLIRRYIQSAFCILNSELHGAASNAKA